MEKEIIQFRHTKSPVISAAKTVNLAAALVSMLTLETAMLTAFGENDSGRFREMMSGATGGVVCTFILLLAIRMLICAAAKMEETT